MHGVGCIGLSICHSDRRVYHYMQHSNVDNDQSFRAKGAERCLTFVRATAFSPVPYMEASGGTAVSHAAPAPALTPSFSRHTNLSGDVYKAVLSEDKTLAIRLVSHLACVNFVPRVHAWDLNNI